MADLAENNEENLGFIKLPRDLSLLSGWGASPSAFVIYIFLLTKARWQESPCDFGPITVGKDQCFFGIRQLSSLIGLSIGTVSAALLELEQLGAIEVENTRLGSLITVQLLALSVSNSEHRVTEGVSKTERNVLNSELSVSKTERSVSNSEPKEDLRSKELRTTADAEVEPKKSKNKKQPLTKLDSKNLSAPQISTEILDPTQHNPRKRWERYIAKWEKEGRYSIFPGSLIYVRDSEWQRILNYFEVTPETEPTCPAITLVQELTALGLSDERTRHGKLKWKVFLELIDQEDGPYKAIITQHLRHIKEWGDEWDALEGRYKKKEAA